MSFRYGKKSTKKLGSAHPDLQLIFNTAIQYIDITILEGHRTKEVQDTYVSRGASKVEWPNSKHNSTPSNAVDAAPYPIPFDWGLGSRDEIEKFKYLAFLVKGVAYGLYEAGKVSHLIRWGGDWDNDNDVLDQSFDDLVHFELCPP